jgi:hypothetical protein
MKNIQQNSKNKYRWALISLIFFAAPFLFYWLAGHNYIKFPGDSLLLIIIIIIIIFSSIFGIIALKKGENKLLSYLGIFLAPLIVITAIILVEVNSRQYHKSYNIMIKQTMDSLRSSAEMFYNSNDSSYADLEDSKDFIKAKEYIVNECRGKDFIAKVSQDGQKYCSEVFMPTVSSFYCIDSAGTTVTTSTSVCLDNYFSCTKE